MATKVQREALAQEAVSTTINLVLKARDTEQSPARYHAILTARTAVADSMHAVGTAYGMMNPYMTTLIGLKSLTDQYLADFRKTLETV